MVHGTPQHSLGVSVKKKKKKTTEVIILIYDNSFAESWNMYEFMKSPSYVAVGWTMCENRVTEKRYLYL